MDLFLRRHPPTPQGIFGELLVNGQWECWTLEDQGTNLAGHPLPIPAGTYPVEITPSQRFHHLLPWVNVPGYSGIRIHAGNTTADTEGCILVGRERTAEGILLSRLALESLQSKLASAQARHEPITLTVGVTSGEAQATSHS